MALTGLFLCTFLVVHLIGNLQLLYDDNGESFNVYAKFMTTFPLIKIVSYLLYFSILFHSVDGFILMAKNRKARPIKYAYNKPNANSALNSRIMGILGSLVLIFIITHMAMYWGEMHFGGLEMISYETGQVISKEAWEALPLMEQELYVKDLYPLVKASYTTGVWGLPGIAWVIVYVVAQFILGFHLFHGIQSAFQSLGVRHTRYTPIIKGVGKTFAVLMAIGFSVIPVMMYLGCTLG